LGVVLLRFSHSAHDGKAMRAEAFARRVAAFVECRTLDVGRWTFGPAQRLRHVTTRIQNQNAPAAGQTFNVQRPTTMQSAV